MGAVWPSDYHADEITEAYCACSFGADAVIDPTDDLTRVALDTIALCSMSHRQVPIYSAA